MRVTRRDISPLNSLIPYAQKVIGDSNACSNKYLIIFLQPHETTGLPESNQIQDKNITTLQGPCMSHTSYWLTEVKSPISRVLLSMPL